MENIINENLKETPKNKDYIIGLDVLFYGIWFHSLENIDDYFYT